MHAQRWVVILALGFLAFAASQAGWSRPTATANADTAAPVVQVIYQDPRAFSETRDFPYVRFDHGDYLQQLQAYLVRRATPMLQPGQRLTVTFTNIKLAGSYEPWRGVLWQDVRFMRNIYPPRMTFHFQLTSADGELVREGTRKLVGTGYMYTTPMPTALNDPLHYDKALLAGWLRRGPQRW